MNLLTPRQQFQDRLPPILAAPGFHNLAARDSDFDVAQERALGGREAAKEFLGAEDGAGEALGKDEGIGCEGECARFVVDLPVDEEEGGADVVGEEGGVRCCGGFGRGRLVDGEGVGVNFKAEFEREGKEGGGGWVRGWDGGGSCWLHRDCGWV